ncbi:MAG: hypothetical protein KGI26_00075 [Thaumarchaeota archaeon]|nr:hypothetical protein [Nitrososphaerota archaeon]
MTIGRFQVMSLLQAARAYALGLPLESAYSWGLNRAIFIAAAKRGFKGGSGAPEGSAKGAKGGKTYSLGDDMAHKVEEGGVVLFTIGGKVQTRVEFDKRVKDKFGKSFPAAWKEALAYVKRFDRSALLSRDEFFNTVYRPVRDEWAERWSAVSDQA